MSQEPVLPSEIARRLALRQRKAEKVCDWCGRPFVRVLRAKYCSQICACRAYRARHRDELNAKRRAKYHQQKAEREKDDAKA